MAWAGKAAHPNPPTRGGGRLRAAGRPVRPGVRRANVLDRYSLALQIIQVFPVVLQVAALMVAPIWLRFLLSGAGLVAGTVWVVYLERASGRTRPGPERRRPAPVAVPDRDPALSYGRVGTDCAVALTDVAAAAGVLNIRISLHVVDDDIEGDLEQAS